MIRYTYRVPRAVTGLRTTVDREEYWKRVRIAKQEQAKEQEAGK